MSMREDWEQRGWEAGYHGKPLEPLLLDEVRGCGQCDEFAKKRNTYVKAGYAEGVKERERQNGRASRP